MSGVKSNIERGKNAILLVKIVMIVHLFSFVIHYFQYDMFTEYLRSMNAGYQSIKASEIRGNAINQKINAGLNVVATIISAITFILWFRRAYTNLEHRTDGLKYKNGWAVASWFVPIVWWVIPYQMMSQMFRFSINILNNVGEEVENKNIMTKINWWWGIWVFIQIFAFYIQSNAKSGTITSLIDSTFYMMILSVLYVPLGIYTISMIKSYMKIEIALSILPETNYTRMIPANDELLDSGL